jgi:small nuclear ribonucleoprotein (snRNP)-like protein
MSPVAKQPIIALYGYYQSEDDVEVWLFEDTATRFQGKLAGFDEYMNLTLTGTRELRDGQEPEMLGTIMLKADCISLIRPVPHV